LLNRINDEIIALAGEEKSATRQDKANEEGIANAKASLDLNRVPYIVNGYVLIVVSCC
jgi:hypothetical protein